MSYQTVEVDLENGRVRPRGTDALPLKARALLTIVEETAEDIQDSNPPAVSLADRVRHLAGIGSGEFADLSTNKEHLNDLGR